MVSNSKRDKFIALIFAVFMQISLRQVAANGYKQYIKSRPSASSESVKRSKQIDTATLSVHPLFSKCQSPVRYRLKDDGSQTVVS